MESIEEKIRQNIKRLQLHPVHHRRFIVPNEEQIMLTNRWILSNKDDFLTEARRLRKVVDERFIKDPDIMAEIRSREAMYPYGLCRQLRDVMLEELKLNADNNEYPGLTGFNQFVRSGGIVQPFWGIDKGVYFENAIQIGSAILDVANDTVDMDKVSVVFYDSLEESTIKPVESFDDFARVGESYWKQDMYPNIYLPALAPVFPLLTVEKVRATPVQEVLVLRLQTGAGDLHYKNFFTPHKGRLFGLSYRFLLESEYGKRRLPRQLFERLGQNNVLAKFGGGTPDRYVVTSSPDLFKKYFDDFPAPQKASDISLENLRLADRMQKAGMELDKVVLATALV